MWTRKELKDKAKVSFRANYWKSVLVALVVVAVVGGMGFFSPSSSLSSLASSSAATVTHTPKNVDVDIEDGKISVDVDDDDGETVHVNVDADDIDELADAIEVATDTDRAHIASSLIGPGMVLAGFSLTLVMLVIMAVAIALYAFLLSPLEVGARRFFVRNLNQRAEVKEVAYGYDSNYKEIVKTIFLRSLFVFLWGLLLVIPGIYKSYEYRMIPYLLAEDPTMTKDRAFAESKRMMDGQKWNTFVLDLSFLGWNILSLLTMGILGAFYVGPYQAQTNAALYEKLRYGLPTPAPVAQPASYAPAANAQPQGQAQTQGQVAPVIVSTAQPPVPPFAAVGAEPADGGAEAPQVTPDGEEGSETSDSPDA